MARFLRATGRHRKRPGSGNLTGSETETVAIIPVRNEGLHLNGTLRSLADQTVPPNRIVVVVNNSTDNTEHVARQFAGQANAPDTKVLVMPGVNRWKKAGALNYGIRYLKGTSPILPQSIRYILTTDGDTHLHSKFIERARSVLNSDPRLAGVSACVLGTLLRGRSVWSRLLLLAQRAEYAYFSEARLRRNIHTISGAGSFYNVDAINSLLAVRCDVFEERAGGLVEDYETTLALKQLGWRITGNQWCIAYTDLMPTMKSLIDQRVRWVRGTVDEWRRYGWCKATRLSIIGMILGFAGTLYTVLWLTVSVNSIAGHGKGLDPRYLLLALFWAVYRVWQVRHSGLRIIMWEAALLPEWAFNLVRTYWLVQGIAASYLGRAATWSEGGSS